MSASSKPLRDGKDWNREESVLAFDLYCRIPFRKTKANNPDVIALAQNLHRTPASVARKLGNFGAFDPTLRKKQISGLTHTSKLDRAVWQEFNSDWANLVIEADRIRQQITGQSRSIEPEKPIEIIGPTEREVIAKQRIYQGFFRESVLSGYDQRCCICGLPHPEILIASHIIPWSVREDVRVNPQNGLCLCASHDLAFEGRLIGIGLDFSILLSKRAKESKDLASQFLFSTYEGKRILLPDRFPPRPEFLSWRLDKFIRNRA
jgi:putative restriction endonuclease